MNLRQLRYFVKVVEAGNMTRAAAELFVAQPALGMQIRQLEEDLGVELLKRHSRGITPTPAGALLHERARTILALVESTRREVAASTGEGTEHIRLGLTPALMLQVGPDLAVQVRDRLPQVVLSLVEDMSHVLVEALGRGDIDLALAYDVPAGPEVSRTALFEDDLVLVTLPDRAGNASVPFEEVTESPLVLPEAGDTVRDLVVRTAQSLGIAPRIDFEVRSIAAIKRMIERGVANGVLPFSSVAEEARAGTLAARAIVSPALTRTLYVAASTRRPRFRNELALVGTIRSTLAGLVEALGPSVRPLPPQPV